VPFDSDPFGNGDDGATALQASDGTWWVRKEAKNGISRPEWWGFSENNSPEGNSNALEKAIDFVDKGEGFDQFVGENGVPESGKVVLPVGQYKINTVNATYPSLHIEGQGLSQTVLEADTSMSGGDPLIEINGTPSDRIHNVTIKGIGFVGSEIGNTEQEYNDEPTAIVATEMSYWNIDRCLFQRLRRPVNIEKSWVGTFSSCVCFQTFNGPIFNDGTNSLYVENCRFGGVYDNNYGATIRKCRSVNFVGNNVEFSPIGLEIIGGDGINVTGNYFESNTDKDLRIRGVENTNIFPQGVNVSTNIFNSSNDASFAIKVRGRDANEVIKGVEISGNDMDGVYGQGFIQIFDYEAESWFIHSNNIDSGNPLTNLPDADEAKMRRRTRNEYNETNVTESRSFDADSATVGELADVVGSLIKDLRDAGNIQ
jgi:hypothetical protein